MSALDTARAASLAARGLTEADPGIGLGREHRGRHRRRPSERRRLAGAVPVHAAWRGLAGCLCIAGRASRRAAAWLGNGDSMGAAQRLAVPARGSAVAEQRTLRPRLRRGERAGFARQHDTNRGADGDRAFLAGDAVGDLESRRPAAHRGSRPRLSDTPRTLALMYLAAADASIVCWDVNTRTTSGGRKRRFGTVKATGTTRPSAIPAGSHSFPRRRIPNTSRATRPTAARWAPFSSSFLATTPACRSWR